MRVARSIFKIAFSAIAAFRLVSAYIDPNTGGMLFQLLAGFLAIFSAILLFFSRQIRMFVARLGRFLRGIRSGQ